MHLHLLAIFVFTCMSTLVFGAAQADGLSKKEVFYIPFEQIVINENGIFFKNDTALTPHQRPSLG